MATTTTKQTKASADATTKVITIVDRSTKALEKVTNDLGAVFAQVDQAKTILADTAEKVELKNQELQLLDNQFAEKLDEQEYQLRIKVRDNEDQVLRSLLTKFGLAHISSGDLQSLKQDLLTAQKDNAKELEDKVEEIRSNLHSEYANKVKAIEADHRVELAQKNATIESLTYKVQTLQDTNQSLQDSIDKERQARVQIAQADAQKQGVTVNTGKN